MALEANIISRLSFIKYLYNFAIDQSFRPEPFCAISILMFHNAVELFNQLSLEYSDIKVDSKKINFIDYWEHLNITQKEAMKRLNNARISLKHHGNLPSKLIIESFRSCSTSFFEENMPIMFGVEFEEISLIDIIKFEPSKINLKEGQKLIKENKIKEAMSKVAIAFSQLIRDYEKRKTIFGMSPFFFVEKIGSFGDLGIRQITQNQHISLTKSFDKIKKSVESIQDVLKILALGIDYRKYARFKLVTPRIYWSVGESYFIDWPFHVYSAEPTIEDTQFCINFVIEAAIILQDFDYEFEREGYTTRIKLS